MDYHNIIIENIEIKEMEKYKYKILDKESKNLKVLYNNKEIKIRTPKVNLPFGIEKNKNGNKIITMETKKISKFYIIMKCIEEYIKETFKKSFDQKDEKNDYDYDFISNIRESKKNGYVLICRNKMCGSRGEEKELRGEKRKFDIELTNVWIKDNKYGINWEIKNVLK